MWEEIAMQAANTLGNKAFDIADDVLFGKYRSKRQLEQQKKLTDIQVDANKQLADYGMVLQKELFHATGYGAQRKQMEEAGLNPALMYGHAGAGGTTGTPATGSAGMGQSSTETERKMASIQAEGMALQNRLLSSQVRNIDADTEQKLATAEKTRGVDTEVAKATLDNIIKDSRGKDLQNTFNEIQNDILSDTWFDKVNEIKWNSTKARYDMEITLNNRDISDATKAQAIDSYSLQVQNLATDILLKDAKINLTREQAEAVSKNVMNNYINALANKEQASKWTWQQALGNALVESGINKEVSDNIASTFNAIEKLMPRDNDTFLKWLKRNW
jgi:hypothetical protein